MSQIFRAAALGAVIFLFALPAAAKPVQLDLMHGWKNVSGYRKAAISSYKGIVHLEGAIQTSGTDDAPFVVPAAFRPPAEIAVKLSLCNATNGHLIINADGTTLVQAEHDFSDAQCFTSLDGVSYSLDGYKNVTLENGWKPYGFSFGHPAAKAVNGIVHLQGAMKGGKTDVAFVLPPQMRPLSSVFLPVDMVNRENGRIEVATDGTVSVAAEDEFQTAKEFTSLDGAFFALGTTGFTPLTLAGGWTGGPFGTAEPAARVDHGVVELQGAVENTSSTGTLIFTLPVGFRPAKAVAVPVDMCNATNGKLAIDPSGAVSVQAESDFANAACFTSLDGVSFHL
jgi:hypothetical protein